MFPLLFTILRARIVWMAIGVAAAACVAFVFTVAVMAAAVIAVDGGDVDSDRVTEVATSLGLLAAVAAMSGLVAARIAVRRSRVRRWVPLYQAMVRDAASVPDTYLAEILTGTDPAAAGHVMAADLGTGVQAPLWLPGLSMPCGTIVCFKQTSAGPQVRAWMSRRLWRACAREATRVERRSARAEHARHQAREESIREAVDDMVTAAEQMLREQDRS